MWIVLCFACVGKDEAVTTGPYDDYVWPDGATAPKIFSAKIYCQSTDAGLQTFLELEVNDPQGPFDIRQGTWKSYSPSNELLAEDILYCDLEKTCYYSFTPDQYPLLPCDQLGSYTTEAQLEDYSGNLSEWVELEYLGIE